jgi:hypothetical protein
MMSTWFWHKNRVWHLHQVSYSCHDHLRCTPCRTCHLHTMRQANTILQWTRIKVKQPKCPRFEFKHHQVNDSSQSNQGTDHLVSQFALTLLNYILSDLIMVSVTRGVTGGYKISHLVLSKSVVENEPLRGMGAAIACSTLIFAFLDFLCGALAVVGFCWWSIHDEVAY